LLRKNNSLSIRGPGGLTRKTFKGKTLGISALQREDKDIKGNHSSFAGEGKGLAVRRESRVQIATWF
jgi:hypothetical protein